MALSRKDILILSFFYLVSRCLFLTRYPIFNDEAIYLRYAWVMSHVPGQLWYSLSDSGKQPLLYWIYGISWQLVGNPLLAGRIVSVFIGLTTVWAVYLLGGWIAGILFITAPLFIFFDRLALVDNALAALFAWQLVLLVRLEKRNAIRTAVLVGILVGVSLWIKSTGFLFALVAGLEFVFLWYSQKRARSIAVALLVFIAVAGNIGFPLFFRPEYVHIFQMASEYTYTVKELFAQNFGNLSGNVLHAVLDYAGYVSPLIVLAFVLSVRSIVTQKRRVLFTSWLLAFIVVVVFGRNIHARYILFTAIPVIVLSSFALSTRKILLGVTVALMSVLSAILIIDTPMFFHLFPTAQLRAESYAYVDGWSSGYGVKEVLAAIDADRHGEQALVAVRWDSGNPEDAMFVYTKGNPQITTKYLDPRLPKEAYKVLDASARGRVYFVTRQGQYNGFERYLTPLGQFSKPGGKEKIELFRVRI